MDAQDGGEAGTQLKFEEALSRLEAIVAEMESGRQTLEESLGKFEEGMALSRFCAAKLAETEKTIEVLIKRADRSLEWQSVEAEELGGPSDSGDADV